MAVPQSLTQVAVTVGVDGFFVLFLWRMAKRLYPLIDAIKEMGVTGAANLVEADHREDPISIETGSL